MDYFQGVVTEYLRADRAVFVNTECLIQLQAGDSLAKGEHWYCDAVALDMRTRAVYLCETTYSANLGALFARLKAWSKSWGGIRAALIRDSAVPAGWPMQPWVFIPEGRGVLLREKLSFVEGIGSADGQMPFPRITHLECVVPWKYRTWDRKLAALEGEVLEGPPLAST